VTLNFIRIFCTWSFPNLCNMFNVYGSVHHKYIPICIQQDATLHSLFIPGNCSTFFVWCSPIIRSANNCIYNMWLSHRTATYFSRNTNNMQFCNKIYYSKVYWRLNMFRAAHRSSSGALNCICSLWFIYCNKVKKISYVLYIAHIIILQLYSLYIWFTYLIKMYG
jgi:hypothetical protein